MFISTQTPRTGRLLFRASGAGESALQLVPNLSSPSRACRIRVRCLPSRDDAGDSLRVKLGTQGNGAWEGSIIVSRYTEWSAVWYTTSDSSVYLQWTAGSAGSLAVDVTIDEAPGA